MQPGFSLLPIRRSAVVALLALPLFLAGCSTINLPAVESTPAATAFGHVHAISVDPITNKILLATHDGLYDATTKMSVKISETTIDLMGFTATAEADTFYASGHPGPDSSLPNPVGLIQSTDAGKTWESASLGGESDFHALTISGGSLVGFDGQLRTSPDGIAWTTPPTTFVPAVLAGSPASTVVLATTEDGVQRSTDSGNTWQPVLNSPIIQFVAWASSPKEAPKEAIGVAPDGSVFVSTDRGQTWAATGKINGQVEAITAVQGSPGNPSIWAATTTEVQISTDGGMTFNPA